MAESEFDKVFKKFINLRLNWSLNEGDDKGYSISPSATEFNLADFNEIYLRAESNNLLYLVWWYKEKIRIQVFKVGIGPFIDVTSSSNKEVNKFMEAITISFRSRMREKYLKELDERKKEINEAIKDFWDS